MQLYQWTATAALVLLTLEMVVPTFFFAAGAVGVGCVAVLHYLTGAIRPARDLIVCAVGFSGAFVAFRAGFRHPSDVRRSEDDIHQYADQSATSQDIETPASSATGNVPHGSAGGDDP